MAVASAVAALAGADVLVQIRKPGFQAKHPRSLGTDRVTRKEHAEVAEIEAELLAEGAYKPRPLTRGECPPAEEPCPFIRCRFHLALDVVESGAVKITHFVQDDIVDLAAMPETCSLRVADKGGHGYTAVGKILGLSLERVRQLEQEALANVRRKLAALDNVPPAMREAIARLMEQVEPAP